MENIATELDRRIAAIATLNVDMYREIQAALQLAREVEHGDDENVQRLFQIAALLGHEEQARHGQMIQVLAQADRAQAGPEGLAPWITAHLDATDYRARCIVQAVRRIGHIPELAEPLSSGRIGADTVRTLLRTARAIADTDHDADAVLAATLELAEREGPTVANRHVRQLEEFTDPCRAERLLARQRKRSFARMTEVSEGGMQRFEALLDPVRATTVRAAIDLEASALIRARQSDDSNAVPDDVHSAEQLQAHVLTRLAEVFLAAEPDLRRAASRASTVRPTTKTSTGSAPTKSASSAAPSSRSRTGPPLPAKAAQT